MKSFILALSIVFASNTFASTTDSYSLPINGDESTERFVLNAEQTKTLYRTEIVDSTCYRTVQNGYEMQCNYVPEVVCYNTPDYPRYPSGPGPGHGGHPGQGPGHRPGFGGPRPRQRVCETRYVNRCYSVPRYVQEAYSCKKSMEIPYEVFDYNVKASVDVVIKNPTKNVAFNSCDVDFVLFGSNLSAQSSCRDYIIQATKSNTMSNLSNKQVEINSKYELTVQDLATAVAPVSKGISNLRMEGQTVVFKTGNLTKNKNFTLKLYVERRKLLKSDVVIINRNLSPSEYTYEAVDAENGNVKISLTKLFGGINKNKKHIINVELKLKDSFENALNKDIIPALKVSRSITVNN